MKLITLSCLLATSLALLAGCPAKPPPGTPPVVQEPPAGDDPLLTPDGRHFAASRTYQGECMPAGSRGGCYSVTLEPTGHYRNVLLDAAMTGSYVIEGDQVNLKPDGGAPATTMTLSADRLRLDDYVYQPDLAP